MFGVTQLMDGGTRFFALQDTEVLYPIPPQSVLNIFKMCFKLLSCENS